MSDRAASPDDNLIASPGSNVEDVSGVEAEIRTFLIADVRGYTSFTQELETRRPESWLRCSR